MEVISMKTELMAKKRKKKRGRGTESHPDGCELHTPQRVSDSPVVALYSALQAFFESADVAPSQKQVQDFQGLARECGEGISVKITFELLETVREHVARYRLNADRNCCQVCLDFILAAFRDLSRVNDSIALDIRYGLVEILKFQSALIVWVEKIQPDHGRRGAVLTVHTNDMDRFILLFSRVDHGQLLDTQSGVIIFDC